MEDRPILRLDEELIGKIAAGEVVESPASAVKELVENSLDAGASCVTVELRDGGVSYLRVTDNGRGIPPRDVRLAFERHATSKIRRTGDLFDLHTLGFRGEALASIAAVSKLTLTTRRASESAGTRAINEGGVIRSVSEAASPQGTTIVARDLFYNTPVRRKFLKKPATEAGKVAEVIARLILSRPDVSFRLIVDGRQVYLSSGNGDLRGAVFCLYGRETASAMTAVHAEGGVSVDGLVGVGPLSRANRQRQTFIVNGRTIRSPLLTQALEDGCRERFTVGHYPICVLNIAMPAASVDVNVHPNKLEVRFSDERLVYEAVRGAVADSFGVSPLGGAPEMTLSAPDGREASPSLPAPDAVRVIDTKTPEGIERAREAVRAAAGDAPDAPKKADAPKTADAPRAPEAPKQADATPPPEAKKAPEAATPDAGQAQFKAFVTEYFGGAALRESAVAGTPRGELAFGRLDAKEAKPAPQAAPEAKRGEPAGEEAPKRAPAAETPQEEQQSLFPEGTSAPPAADGLKLVGVAFDTYIILQDRDRLLFIDQHAAHERILYERLMREIDRGGGSQMLLTPLIVHVTPQDRAKLEQFTDDIRAAGYDAEPFGDDDYRIRAVPNVLGEPQSRAAFLELLDKLGELRVLATQQKRRDAILQMACKRAVKGGDRLTLEEIRPLLADMLASGAPPTCPHGRPLVVALTRTELEKKFRRINS